MALLRACADAVVAQVAERVHDAVLEPHSRHRQPDFPAAEVERHALHRGPLPGTGRRDARGDVESEALGERLRVRDDLVGAVDELRERGRKRILCEGGPTLFGSLLSAGVVDELFLTVSPLIAGHGLSLVEGMELLPHRRVAASLAGVRRDGSHLFLRYLLER
ncbi:MAG: hypothetical protein E6F98_07540 [Actinobacteria bacterium]|nr:MAG: hypothetical protein E6F98_07540 [Actinomycetota bacterium]